MIKELLKLAEGVALQTPKTESGGVKPKDKENIDEAVSTAYLDEYVKSEVVPKLKKYIYSKDKVKLVWDLNELRKLLESITNIPPDDVLEVLADLEIIEVKNNQAIIKTIEEGR